MTVPVLQGQLLSRPYQWMQTFPARGEGGLLGPNHQGSGVWGRDLHCYRDLGDLRAVGDQGVGIRPLLWVVVPKGGLVGSGQRKGAASLESRQVPRACLLCDLCMGLLPQFPHCGKWGNGMTSSWRLLEMSLASRQELIVVVRVTWGPASLDYSDPLSKTVWANTRYRVTWPLPSSLFSHQLSVCHPCSPRL